MIVLSADGCTDVPGPDLTIVKLDGAAIADAAERSTLDWPDSAG